MVSWTPVNLTVVDHYTVHYTTVGGVNGTVIFSTTSSSGVVSGLQEGQEYWFSITVTLNVNGEVYTGSFNHSVKCEPRLFYTACTCSITKQLKNCGYFS